MTTKIQKVHTARSIILLLLLACFVTVTVAAGENGMPIHNTPGPDLNITNYSVSTDAQTSDFVAGPTPITILRVELNQSTLPGPRDMGYGPSAINLSIAPQVLAAIFILILIGIVVYVIWKRTSETTPDAPEQKK